MAKRNCHTEGTTGARRKGGSAFVFAAESAIFVRSASRDSRGGCRYVSCYEIATESRVGA